MVLSEREMIADAEAWLRNNEVANGQISARRLRSCLKIPALAAEEDLAAGCRALAAEMAAEFLEDVMPELCRRELRVIGKEGRDGTDDRR